MDSCDELERILNGTIKRARTRNPHELFWALFYLYQGIFVRNFSRDIFDFSSTNIYDLDWDVLVLLDACRVDVLADHSNDHWFLDHPLQSVCSVGGDSNGWMERTFVSDHAAEMANTAYITANPHSELVLDSSEFSLLDEVWRYSWDDELGTVPPRPVTDRAIEAGREGNSSRLIVHYMQPHFPSIPNPELGSEIIAGQVGSDWNDSIWDKLLHREISYQEAWGAYSDNLSLVLNEVALLFDNISADRAVVSADHGNAFGEYGFYGHGEYPLRCVRDVPWVVTSTTDSRTRIPEPIETEPEEVTNTDIESRLEALGYVT